ncbi:hypothetical protein COCSUDRAFT_53569 [Coccomyxa subellipsoidea C-169]|uniref:Trypsin-like serine protease n=1 Tax=Coccomyxa subellipsoidea (strain C-169) TaxID=574566 RepID=I0YY49_COCSC|nr:hypothetical protein COCSUDRAFT_53569 [Coccomyxa subellipsoidea C-169]EIE23318.1 hypothetical protein COCSUDRAFT_53569 [Coccomyxa subellipsoidea C-169]|eukprot:XP_005647862.1 hypothetical protein COCSUDRAFT_53569 [Coccomyxa subellipsoidea C-169]
MAVVRIRVVDGDRVSTESLRTPITAGEARETLQQYNRRWMGKLAAVGSEIHLGGRTDLVPGETYILTVTRDAGLEEKLEGLAELVAGHAKVLLPETIDLVKTATCLFADEDDQFTGLGCFYGPHWGITCYHNLVEPLDSHDPNVVQEPSLGEEIEVYVFKQGRYQRISVTITELSKEHDFVCFITEQEQPFLQLHRDPSVLESAREFVLCSFHLQAGLGDLASDFGIGLAPYRALFLRFSKHANHMVYDVNCAPGDSGAALLLFEGRVIGMHQEGINNLIGEFDPTRPMHARLDDLTESALAAARSVGQGGLGLLARCFPQAV